MKKPAKAVINQKGERYHYQYDHVVKDTDYGGLEICYRRKTKPHAKPDKSITEYHYDASGLLLCKLT